MFPCYSGRPAAAWLTNEGKWKGVSRHHGAYLVSILVSRRHPRISGIFTSSSHSFSIIFSTSVHSLVSQLKHTQDATKHWYFGCPSPDLKRKDQTSSSNMAHTARISQPRRKRCRTKALYGRQPSKGAEGHPIKGNELPRRVSLRRDQSSSSEPQDTIRARIQGLSV